MSYTLITPHGQGVAEGSGFDQEAGIGIDGKSFKFKIRDLVALADNYPVTKIDPQQFSKQIAGRDEDSTQSMARAEKADLQYPIIVVKRQNGQLWIADGTHRAHKAIMHKLPSINAKIIPIKDMAPFDVDQGVAEGQDDKAEAYRAHLIKTLPQIMKLFANIGKGWIPSKEQMLSAVDTAYIVMKHTGDVKQAGKVLMDELNTLHKMSQGKQGVAEEMQHKKITELFDAKTSFPLKWDTQFASSGEVHAEAYDADGRIIDISFTPTGYGSGIEIVFKRGGSYDMTGHGDAPRVLATVVNAISQYLQKYQPPYIAFSAKSTGGRAGAYAAMIRRLARGYKLLTPDEYPDDTTGFLDFLGSDKPFILARS